MEEQHKGKSRPGAGSVRPFNCKAILPSTRMTDFCGRCINNKVPLKMFLQTAGKKSGSKKQLICKNEECGETYFLNKTRAKHLRDLCPQCASLVGKGKNKKIMHNLINKKKDPEGFVLEEASRR